MNLIPLFGLLVCAAVVVLGVRMILRQRARALRREAARARRLEQDRIWHERIRERAAAEGD